MIGLSCGAAERQSCNSASSNSTPAIHATPSSTSLLLHTESGTTYLTDDIDDDGRVDDDDTVDHEPTIHQQLSNLSVSQQQQSPTQRADRISNRGVPFVAYQDASCSIPGR